MGGSVVSLTRQPQFYPAVAIAQKPPPSITVAKGDAGPYSDDNIAVQYLGSLCLPCAPRTASDGNDIGSNSLPITIARGITINSMCPMH